MENVSLYAPRPLAVANESTKGAQDDPSEFGHVGRILNDVSLSLYIGQSLIITGQSGVGKSSLLRAISGLWSDGHGVIRRCSVEKCFFVPQQPYMCLGSLREQALYPDSSTSHKRPSDADIEEALASVNLAHLTQRYGLDWQIDFANTLSLGEQQRLGFVRVLLRRDLELVIVDEGTSALDEGNEAILYGLLRTRVRSFVSVGHRSSLHRYHTHCLHIERTPDGRCSIALSACAEGPSQPRSRALVAQTSGAALPARGISLTSQGEDGAGTQAPAIANRPSPRSSSSSARKLSPTPRVQMPQSPAPAQRLEVPSSASQQNLLSIPFAGSPGSSLAAPLRSRSPRGSAVADKLQGFLPESALEVVQAPSQSAAVALFESFFPASPRGLMPRPAAVLWASVSAPWGAGSPTEIDESLDGGGLVDLLNLIGSSPEHLEWGPQGSKVRSQQAEACRLVDV